MTKNGVAEHGPHAWDRQPGETPTAYAAFTRYRDIGPTIDRLTLSQWPCMGNDGVTGADPYGAYSGGQPATIGRKRAEAWDSFVDVQDREQARATGCPPAQRHNSDLRPCTLLLAAA